MGIGTIRSTSRILYTVYVYVGWIKYYYYRDLTISTSSPKGFGMNEWLPEQQCFGVMVSTVAH
jgi:hypothetical protein